MHPNNIDELFRSAIDPFEEPPSPGLWNNIEKDLDRDNIISIKRKYANLKKIAIVLTLLLSSALMYELLTSYFISQNKHILQKTTVSSIQKKTHSGSGITVKKTKSFVDKLDPLSPVAELRNYSHENTKDTRPGSGNAFPITSSKEHDGVSAGEFASTAREVNQAAPVNGYLAKEFDVESASLSNTPANRKLLLTSGFSSYVNQAPSAEVVSRQIHPFNEPIKATPPDLALAAPVVATSVDRLIDGSKISVTKMRKRSPFSLTLIFSPDFTSRRVKADWIINQEDNSDAIRNSERYAFSYSFGALVDYSINRRWSVETGFTLSSATININPKFIFARPDNLGEMKYKFNSSSGYTFLATKFPSRPAFGDSLHAFGSKSSLQYVSVPLAVKYKLGKKKIHFYGLAGVAANILVKEKIETSLFNGPNHELAINKEIRGLKPVYFSALAAAGAEYHINKTLTASLTPTARFALSSINKDAPVKSYQQSLGLVAGVQISF